jgi:hypothetical protein
VAGVVPDDSGPGQGNASGVSGHADQIGQPRADAARSAAGPDAGSQADGTGSDGSAETQPESLTAVPTRSDLARGHLGSAPNPGDSSFPHQSGGQQRDAGALWPASGDSITHYHGEFRNQPVDLYTDGTRWAPGDRVPGENVVGHKPAASPADTSGLPPPGDELPSIEDSKLSRFEAFRRETEKEENLDGLHSEIENDASTIQKWLQGRPPAGRADQPVPASPHISPVAGHYEVDAGSVAAMGLMLGVLSAEAVRWSHRKLEALRGK